MIQILIILLIAFIIVRLLSHAFPRKKPDISHLPERFVVVDLETTGLDPEKDEIIEIGAIRINRDATQHETFQTLVRHSKKRLPKKITQITGITQAMIDAEGVTQEEAIRELLEFIGDLHLVAFNAAFDMAFLERTARRHGYALTNPYSCALQMARRAWPGRRSYRLSDLHPHGPPAHRALSDCERAATVYLAAAAILRSID